ncbi:MAG: response regulator [Planctomycetes bacterium]|nr:response regulator [Planctomycetota bacterium]
MGQNDLYQDDLRKRPTVLCIDDDPEISRVLSIRLKNYQVEVLRAFHGMHGFWLAMTEKPDLIITDMRMPQGEGDYVVECLKNNSDTSQIPIFVLTGQRDAGLERKMRNLGVEHYFTKPMEFDELRECIEHYIPLHEISLT